MLVFQIFCETTCDILLPTTRMPGPAKWGKISDMYSENHMETILELKKKKKKKKSTPNTDYESLAFGSSSQYTPREVKFASKTGLRLLAF